MSSSDWHERAICVICKRLNFSLGSTCEDCKPPKQGSDYRLGDKVHDHQQCIIEASELFTAKVARSPGHIEKHKHSDFTRECHLPLPKPNEIIDLLSSEDEAHTDDYSMVEREAISDPPECDRITAAPDGIIDDVVRSKIDPTKNSQMIKLSIHAVDDTENTQLKVVPSVNISQKNALADFRNEENLNTLESQDPDMELVQSKQRSCQRENAKIQEGMIVPIKPSSTIEYDRNQIECEQESTSPDLIQSRIYDTVLYSEADFPGSSRSIKNKSKSCRKLAKLKSMQGLFSPESFFLRVQHDEADKIESDGVGRKKVKLFPEQIPQYGLTIDLTHLDEIVDESDDKCCSMKPDAILKQESRPGGLAASSGRSPGLSPTAFCVLCEHRRSRRGMIRCPVCTKYYHKLCARTYGDEKICWNCELNDMIDDSELTETSRSLVVDMMQTLRNSPSSTDVTSKPIQLVQPFIGKESKAMERWKQFLEKSTAEFDSSFHDITAEITDELKKEDRNERYSYGFTDPKDFQNQIFAVLDKYASKQDQLEKQAKERQCQRAASFSVPTQSTIKPQNPEVLKPSLIETTTVSHSTYIDIDENELLRSSSTINFRNVKV